ncbi:hypothetical protein F5Y05DRAFT_419716 [Hypoxylon sp. FL0543]|nr:hypothetical protein F5Y05DRAFT_419716 [Hypoxylon sp. FL0543]
MSSTELDEKVPFLVVEGALDHEIRNRKNFFLRNKYAGAHGILFALQLVLLALSATFLVSNTISVSNPGGDHSGIAAFERTFSPAESALQYITVEESKYQHHPSLYTGEPRPELDQAWSKLLRSTLLRMTKEEMIKMNKTSLALLDGSGYVGYLESLHMLHCLKRIYQAHHPEHYPEQERNGAFTTAHLYHCLDVLREGVMCNADVTINTLLRESPSQVLGARPGPRKCIDWDRLQAWADDRTLSASDGETFLATLVVPFDESGSIGPVELLR